jgi:hypothetical protein
MPIEPRSLHLRFLRANLRGLVCDYALAALERTLTEFGVPPTDNQNFRFVETAGKVLMKSNLIRNFRRSQKKAFVVCMLDMGEFRMFPQGYFYESVLFCFDCWEWKWPKWEAFLRRNRIRLAFFTARTSALHFAEVIPGLESRWLAEAIDPAEHRCAKPLHERSIHVLELGRNYTQFHDKIVEPMRDAGRRHVFARYDMEIIFEGRQALVDGFADAAISVCFPRSMTHPKQAGIVETMTQRYLESIASKCIPLGKAPQEMIDLFGYNPVVDADLNDPYGQVEYILGNLDRYQPLVQRNYDRMLEVATWNVRVPQILEHVRARGYGVDDFKREAE